MMSNAADRLKAIYDAYSKARERRRQDRREATTAEDKQKIWDNVEKLEKAYLQAARQALDANGAAVETAYKAAKDAQKDVDDAYKAAKSIPQKITLVSNVVTSVGDLLAKARGAAA